MHLQSAVAIAVVGALAGGIYAVAAAVLGVLRRLESDLAVAIIAASATVTVSVITAIVAKRLEAKAAIRQELRARKVPIYE